MNPVKILTHLTAALALAVCVILVIDLFFNSAMYLAAGRGFKLLCLALCVCALGCALALRRRSR